MPISLKAVLTEECSFQQWSITPDNKVKLVEIVSYLYLRQEENAQRVIGALEPSRRTPKGRVAENIVAKLTAPDPEDIKLLQTGTDAQKKSAQYRIDTAIAHRDGLLFQHISWVVAKLAFPNGYMTAPHVRQADKGFDGFIIELDAEGGGIERIVLCEDKASVAPRGLITSKVWPEIISILAGDRDDEIMADLVTLLKSVPAIDAEAAVDQMFWEGARQFRVAVATGEDQHKKGEFLHIVDGFGAAAGGTQAARTAGVLVFNDVRVALADLANEVARKVEVICHV